MEMFILSYANVLFIYPKLCLQVGSAFWAQNLLDKPVCYTPILFLCKWNYLYGDLPFFKIQVNHFMAQDKAFGAKIIPKYILWVRGLVPFWVLRHSLLSLTDCYRLRDFTFTFHFHALEKDMATHSSVLAWRIPGMGEPGGLPSMGSHRVGHDWSDLAAAAAGTV